MNVLTGKIEGQLADLSNLNWINAESVGLQLKAEILPPNVKVWGAPLLVGEHNGLILPAAGSLSYKGITCYPQFVLGGQTIKMTSVSKQPIYTVESGKQTVGWQGSFKVGLNNFPYKIRQWGSPRRDEFGHQVEFTPPVNLGPFAYEMVFELNGLVDRLRFRNVLGRMFFDRIDVDTRINAGADFPINDSGTINFYRGSDKIALYDYHELARKAQSMYWRVENGQFIVGFRFSGWPAGVPWKNDGYFGYGTGDTNSSWNITGWLMASIDQNDQLTGNVTALEVYQNDAIPNGNVKLGLYAELAGAPYGSGAKLGGGVAQVAANGWNDETGLSIAVTLNDYYWIAFCYSANNIIRLYDPGVANGEEENELGYASCMPATFPIPGDCDFYNASYSVRAYVTLPVAGGASVNVVQQMMNKMRS